MKMKKCLAGLLAFAVICGTVSYNNYVMTENAAIIANAETTSSTTTTNVINDSLSPQIVYAKLIEMQEVYPEGMTWTNDNYYAWNGGFYSGGYGCAGFAFALSDNAFGNLPARMHTDFSDIKVGDILRVNDNTHSVIVLEIDGNTVTVAEGNFNSSVHWGRKIDLTDNDRLTYIMTRYPQSVNDSDVTTTTTTIETTTTTTTTIATTPDINAGLEQGDVNGDNTIDSLDASLTLADYVAFSSGSAHNFTEKQLKAADVNRDGVINSLDASNMLAYYVYTSSGGTDSIEVVLGIE